MEDPHERPRTLRTLSFPVPAVPPQKAEPSATKEAPPEPPFTLHIRVIKAKALPKVDIFGAIDAFVVAETAGGRGPPSIIQQNCNPLWNYEAALPVQDPENELVTMLVMDKEHLTQDRVICQAIIPTAVVADGKPRVGVGVELEKYVGPRRTWVKETPGGYGVLAVDLHLVPRGAPYRAWEQPDGKPAAAAAPTPTPPPAPSPQPAEAAKPAPAAALPAAAPAKAPAKGGAVMRVMVESCRELATPPRTSAPDPYVKALFHGQSGKTKHVAASPDPHFTPDHDHVLEFTADAAAAAQGAALSLEVFHKGRGVPDCLLGIAEVPWPVLVEAAAAATRMEIELGDPPPARARGAVKDVSGTVAVVVEWIGAPPTAPAPAAIQPSPAARAAAAVKEEGPGQVVPRAIQAPVLQSGLYALRVTVMEAKNVPPGAASCCTAPSARVVLFMDPSPPGSLPVAGPVAPATQMPSWNATLAPLPVVNAGQELVVRVYDAFAGDELVAHARVPMTRLLAPAGRLLVGKSELELERPRGAAVPPEWRPPSISLRIDLLQMPAPPPPPNPLTLAATANIAVGAPTGPAAPLASRGVARCAARRSVRVFVSSVASDLLAERATLHEGVFPAVSELCRARGLYFSPVDLQYGLGVAEERRGSCLLRALEEADASGPYLVALLGSKYGWVQPHEEEDADADPELAARFQQAEQAYPYLKDHKETGLAEVVLAHALLRRQHSLREAGVRGRAFVYLAAGQDDGPAPAGGEGPTGLGLCRALRARLAAAGCVVRFFIDAADLQRMALNDLSNAVAADFKFKGPAAPRARLLSGEAAQEEAQRRQREALEFAGRVLRPFRRLDANVLDPEDSALDQFAAGAGPYSGARTLCLTGDEGCGKTFHLALLVRRLQEAAQKQAAGGPKAPRLHLAFAAASGSERSLAASLERLTVELGGKPPAHGLAEPPSPWGPQKPAPAPSHKPGLHPEFGGAAAARAIRAAMAAAETAAATSGLRPSTAVPATPLPDPPQHEAPEAMRPSTAPAALVHVGSGRPLLPPAPDPAASPAEAARERLAAAGREFVAACRRATGSVLVLDGVDAFADADAARLLPTWLPPAGAPGARLVFSASTTWLLSAVGAAEVGLAPLYAVPLADERRRDAIRRITTEWLDPRRRNVPLDLSKKILASLPSAGCPLYLAAVMGELRPLIWTRETEQLAEDIQAVAALGGDIAALAPALLRRWAAVVGERPFWDAMFAILALGGGANEAEVRAVAGIAPAALALLRETAAVALGHAGAGSPLSIASLPFARAVRAELLARPGRLQELVRRLRTAVAKRQFIAEREAAVLAAAAATEALAGPAPRGEPHLRHHYLRSVQAASGPLHDAVALCLEAAVRCTSAVTAYIAETPFRLNPAAAPAGGTSMKKGPLPPSGVAELTVTEAYGPRRGAVLGAQFTAKVTNGALEEAAPLPWKAVQAGVAKLVLACASDPRARFLGLKAGPGAPDGSLYVVPVPLRAGEAGLRLHDQVLCVETVPTGAPFAADERAFVQALAAALAKLKAAREAQPPAPAPAAPLYPSAAALEGGGQQAAAPAPAGVVPPIAPLALAPAAGPALLRRTEKATGHVQEMEARLGAARFADLERRVAAALEPPDDTPADSSDWRMSDAWTREGVLEGVAPADESVIPRAELIAPLRAFLAVSRQVLQEALAAGVRPWALKGALTHGLDRALPLRLGRAAVALDVPAEGAPLPPPSLPDALSEDVQKRAEEALLTRDPYAHHRRVDRLAAQRAGDLRGVMSPEVQQWARLQARLGTPEAEIRGVLALFLCLQSLLLLQRVIGPVRWPERERPKKKPADEEAEEEDS